MQCLTVEPFQRALGHKILLVLASFPYFMIGRIKGSVPGAIIVLMEEGVSRELAGNVAVVNTADIAMFYVEREEGEIPSLAEPLAKATPVRLRPGAGGSGHGHDHEPGDGHQPACPVEPGLASALAARRGEDVVLSLRPPQLNLLGQVFRPLVGGTVRQVHADRVLLYPAVLKLPTAPNHVFPTPLLIPLAQIAEILLLPADAIFPLP